MTVLEIIVNDVQFNYYNSQDQTIKQINMSQNYTERQLKTTIIKQNINNQTFYYTVAKKQQKNLSIFKNERLLILDFEEGKIFYVNQTKNLPFRTNNPNPKNQYGLVDSTKVTHNPNSNEIDFSIKFNYERIDWKFVFQTNEVADEWVKLIQFQKQTKETKEKDLKSLNKAIFQMPKVQKQHANDIVKEPQRNIPIEQSRIIHQLVGASRAWPQNQYEKQALSKSKSNYSDWNERFYKNRDILTLFQYKRAAVQAFYSCLKKDSINDKGIRTYEGNSCSVKIANRFTPEAKILKTEYRNYHFIVEATNKQFIVGVPLTALIQFQELVALVKAKFPSVTQQISYDNAFRDQVNELERYTRIKNKVLQTQQLLNLSPHYEPRSQYLIYLNDLHDYLPLNLQFPHQQTLVRPEYMLDNINYFIYSGMNEKIGKLQSRQLKQLTIKIKEKVDDFSNSFYNEEFPVCRIGQLKNILHEGGLNLKYLPHLYTYCNNPQIKRHIYSAMTAKVVKDYIFQNLIKIRTSDVEAPFQKILEQTIGILLSGNNNRSHELWKQISLLFKKKYNIVLNNKELLPGFFFNSIMQLIPADYDMKKVNKRKKIFQESRIIEPGLVRSIQPKVKCFDRFLPDRIQKLKIDAKQFIKSQEVSKGIMKELFNEKDKKYEVCYQFGSNDEWMVQYLSLYYPPQKLAEPNETKINLLYDRINEQPPTHFTMNLTKNYLEWCNKKENTDEFKKIFQVAIGISDYWLDQIHPMRSDLLQILSDYYSILGINQDMIKYMRDSLTISIKFWGQNSQQTGLKQYELADRYLRMCRKKEAVEFFTKAKDNMETNKTKTNKLGLTYMKLASIYLSDLEYDKAIEFAQFSIKSFEEYQRKINSLGIYNQPYKIKAFQVLGRVYQICDRRTDYKDLALNCARKFNSTKNSQVFEQMIRICLASTIFKSSVERCESFLKLIKSLDESNKSSRTTIKRQPVLQLMKLSEDIIVMQKFICKYEYMERSLFEVNSRKRQQLGEDSKEFLTILSNIVEIVGYQYIKGLVEEKISYGN